VKTNKTAIVIAFVIVFLLGIFLGINIERAQNGEGWIDLNPIPHSCRYNGKTYKSGESFPAKDGCNICTCDDGKIACTLMACE
jgi:hypothetical protein